MRVRIDEAGKNHAAAEIQLLGAARFLQALDAAARADRRDAVAVDEQRAIANDAEFARALVRGAGPHPRSVSSSEQPVISQSGT